MVADKQDQGAGDIETEAKIRELVVSTQDETVVRLWRKKGDEKCRSANLTSKLSSTILSSTAWGTFGSSLHRRCAVLLAPESAGRDANTTARTERRPGRQSVESSGRRVVQITPLRIVTYSLSLCSWVRRKQDECCAYKKPGVCCCTSNTCFHPFTSQGILHQLPSPQVLLKPNSIQRALWLG